MSSRKEERYAIVHITDLSGDNSKGIWRNVC